MDTKEMDSSDVLPEDWDIINSNISDIGNKEASIETSETPLPPGWQVNLEDDTHKGSSVEDILPENNEDFHNESNTSSDIDIIDEVIDDSPSTSYGYIGTDNSSPNEKIVDNNVDDPSVTDSSNSEQPSNNDSEQTTAEQNLNEISESAAKETIHMILPPPTVEISAPYTSENFSEPPPEPRTEAGGRRPETGVQSWFFNYFLPLMDRVLNNTHFVHLATALMISFSLVVVFNTTELKVDTFQQLKNNIGKLQQENSLLRSQIMTKMENDKLLHGLEDQIGDLKAENSKLSASLRSLLYQLEKQTSAFQKDQKGKGPYKEEFEKLREQINILRNDNSELQSQLMRLKYSTFHKQHQVKKDEKVKEDEDKNSTETLSQQIQELKKVLNSEVEKLKEWKEGILTLVTKFGNLQRENGKTQYENTEDQTEFKEDQKYWFIQDLKQNLEKKLWSLQDLKESLERSVEKMNILEMLKSMSKDSKKKAEGAFESVSHYFKKAQEKTKKIFDYNNENELWKFFGELRKKWGSIKNDFFDRHYGKKTDFEEETDTTPNPDYAKVHYGKHSYDKYKRAQNQHNPKPGNPEAEEYTGSEDSKDTESDEDDSWMFERAQRRSSLRKPMEEEPDTNWYLRNRRETEEALNEE